MVEFHTPICDNKHGSILMTKVWSDGHGNAEYQCQTVGEKCR